MSFVHYLRYNYESDAMVGYQNYQINVFFALMKIYYAQVVELLPIPAAEPWLNPLSSHILS